MMEVQEDAGRERGMEFEEGERRERRTVKDRMSSSKEREERSQNKD